MIPTQQRLLDAQPPHPVTFSSHLTMASRSNSALLGKSAETGAFQQNVPCHLSNDATVDTLGAWFVHLRLFAFVWVAALAYHLRLLGVTLSLTLMSGSRPASHILEETTS